VRATRRFSSVRMLTGLGLVAGLGALAIAGAAAAPSGPAAALRLRPDNWPGYHHKIAIQGRGSRNRASTVGWASSNWSGYAVTTSASLPFTAITGHWSVPAVAATRSATYSAAWAGIDGFSNSALIQTGTEQDYYNHAAHYAAWWTTSAQGYAEQPISEPVAPGDAMTATITDSGGLWTITLADTTANWSFSTQVAYTGPGTSAEWITEAPTVGTKIEPLAHYGSPLTFDPGTVSINGGAADTPNLVTSDGGEMIQQNRIVSIPSVPVIGEKDGFNMAYGSTAPAAPTS